MMERKLIHLLPGSALLMAWALFAGTAQAQYSCSDYHKFNCERSADTRFSINGQSKSASVQVGNPTELNIIVYKGQDYRVTFCFDRKIIGDHVVARIVEKVRVPVEKKGMERRTITDAEGQQVGEVSEGTRTAVEEPLFEEVRKVLWDNTEHDLSQFVEFSCTATKRLVIEVMAPGAVEPKGRAKGLDIGCVGILIEHMPTPTLGF